jgi:hypothetical protein
VKFDIVLGAKLVTLVSDDIVIIPTSSLLSFRRATRCEFSFKKIFSSVQAQNSFFKKKVVKTVLGSISLCLIMYETRLVYLHYAASHIAAKNR